MSQPNLEAPEDSIPLRLIVFAMTITCITASCLFVPTHWGVTTLSLTLALIGSLVSYQYRHHNQKWTQYIVIAGMIAVGANALNEFLHPMNSVTDFWGPVVHFISGVFALHSFDLKARSNINLSALLGALILCALSPVARSIFFGAMVFGYICLGSLMLYFDCLSRTQHNWLSKPMLAATLGSARGERHRGSAGSTSIAMVILPALALLLFLVIPRCDNFIDIIVSSLKSLNLSGLMQLLPSVEQPPANEPKKNPYDPALVKKIVEKPKQMKPEPGKTAEKAKKEPAKKEPDKKEPEKKPEDSKSPEALKKQAQLEARKNAARDAAKAAAIESKKTRKNNKKSAKQKKSNASAAKKPAGNAGGGGMLTPQQKKALLDKNFNVLFPDKLDLDMEHDRDLGQILLFRVSSTRLFYPRLNVFDTFDGRHWKRGKDDINAQVVEIKSGGGPTDKPVLKDDIARDENGKPLKELSAEEEADLEVAQDEFFKEAEGDSGFGADKAVRYLFTKSEKSTYDVGRAQSLRVPKKVPFIDLTQSYEMLVDIGKSLPICWIPRSVGYAGSVAQVDDYGVISFPEPLKKGATYKVTSSWPVNDINAMRSARQLGESDENALREKLANYLQLPENIDPAVKEFGDAAIGGTGNWFEQAQKICKVLRHHCQHSDEPRPEQAAAEGESEEIDRVSRFLLQDKVGDAADFATAFTILCRQQGLPTRVVAGFMPGRFNEANGTHEITGADAHTWAEVYIPDYGWVAFDATPDGVFPEQMRDDGLSLTTVIKYVAEKLGIPEDRLTPEAIALVGAMVGVGIFLVVAIIFGIIYLRRWLKKRAAEERWSGQEWKVYKALARDLKRISIVRQPTESQKQFVERVENITRERLTLGAEISSDLPRSLDHFFELYQAIHFGDAGKLDFRNGIDELRARAAKVSALAKASKMNGADKTIKSAKGDAASAVRERGSGKREIEGGNAAQNAVRGRGPRP